MAKRWQIKRLAQDELTLTSHQRLDAAYKGGFFDDLISPHRGLTRDNNLRADASLEKLAGLSPAFDRQNGTLTAGNSTPLTDGASVVLLASEEWAGRQRLAGAGLPTHRRNGRGEFCRRHRRPADGPGLRRAAHAASAKA